MTQIFLKGGPIMWPLLILSIVSLTVVLERIAFMISVSINRTPTLVDEILSEVESGKMKAAIALGQETRDFVARPLIYALTHRDKSFSAALLHAAGIELKQFNRGLSVLDTTITLAPLLGLLGTVTGMIDAFGMLGTQELSAPVAITGGIAQALIATAFGLGIAILSLIPYNFLNSRTEQARHEIEDVGTRLELLLLPKAEVTGGEAVES
jgi:biopolymer transport protein ExbB